MLSSEMLRMANTLARYRLCLYNKSVDCCRNHYFKVCNYNFHWVYITNCNAKIVIIEQIDKHYFIFLYRYVKIVQDYCTILQNKY